MKKEKTMRRLFIETDVLQESELDTARITVAGILREKGIPYSDNVFDETKDFAWHEADEAWDAVKRADEIYGDSALVPICGVGTYSGAPVIMDTMMRKTIDEGIKGKSLYFLRPFKDIWWDEIDRDLMRKAFKENKLFTLEFDDDECEYQFTEVDIDKIKDNG